jgi:hypothetical protein
MRIDTSGNLLLGNTNAGAKLDIRQDSGYAIRAENGSGHYFRVAAGGAVEVGGSAFVDGNRNITANDVTVDGNLGIGTSSPVTPLHINSSTTESLIQMTNSSTGTTSSDGFRFGAIGTSVALINREAGAMTFSTSNAEKMRIDSSGNVGIGTSSPSRTLDVRSAGIPANLQSTSTAGGLIDLKHAGTAASNAGAYNGIRFYNGDGFKMAMAHITEASGSGYLQFGTNWAADTGDVMAIHSSGNVGIGTTSPSRKLHINGGTANFVAKFESTDGVGGILVADNSTSVDLAVAAEGNNLSFYNNSERMRIDSSGNLGIGTTSPSAKLHVNGSANISGTTYINDSIHLNLTDGNVAKKLGSIVPVSVGGDDDTGGLELRSHYNNIAYKGLDMLSGGATRLFNSGNEKLATTPTGIDVTGTVVADGLNLGTTGNATLANILSADNTSNTLISGGNATNAGANYALFGGSHASLANVHRWRVGGTEIARFDASGNLGIGTTSPSFKIDVIDTGTQLGSTGYYANSRFSDSSNAGVFLGHNDTANGSGMIAGINKLAFLTYGTAWGYTAQATSV